MNRFKELLAGLSLTVGLALAAIVPVTGAPGPDKAKDTGAAACFARIKSLTGDWIGKAEGSDKETVILHYRVTAGGTAVEETEFPGTEHEMVTLFHLDGDSLVLTHYCHLGNQPHMKASSSSTPDKIAFECTNVGNSKSPNDMHMHAATFTFTDKDHLAAEWTLFQDGKPGFHAKFDARRKG